MPDPYRTSALPAPVRTTIAWGTGERIVLRLPLSPDEVVARLETISQKRAPKRHELPSEAHRRFQGAVRGSSFEMAPLVGPASALRVRGTIQPDGDGAVVTFDIRLAAAELVGAGVSLGFVLFALALCRGSTASLVFYVLKLVAAGVMTVSGAILAVRVGIGPVRRTILTAFDSEAGQ